MKKTITTLNILFLIVFMALGQRVTISPTPNNQISTVLFDSDNPKQTNNSNDNL